MNPFSHTLATLLEKYVISFSLVGGNKKNWGMELPTLQHSKIKQSHCESLGVTKMEIKALVRSRGGSRNRKEKRRKGGDETTSEPKAFWTWGDKPSWGDEGLRYLQ